MDWASSHSEQFGGEHPAILVNAKQVGWLARCLNQFIENRLFHPCLRDPPAKSVVGKFSRMDKYR